MLKIIQLRREIMNMKSGFDLGITFEHIADAVFDGEITEEAAGVLMKLYTLQREKLTL